MIMQMFNEIYKIRQYTRIFLRSSIKHVSTTQKIRSETLSIEKEKLPESGKKQYNLDDLLQHVHSGRNFYLKQLINVFPTIDFYHLKTDDAILLFKLCGSSIKDSSCDRRNNVCQDIYKKLKLTNNLNVKILNQYIKTCTDNKVLIYNQELLNNLEPNKETLSLLLENVCELGQIESALKILEIMKTNNIPLSPENMNNIILIHAVNGGLATAETVLKSLKSAKIELKDLHMLSLYKGLIKFQNFDDFKKAMETYPVHFNKSELIILIEELGLRDLDVWLNEIATLYSHLHVTREFQMEIEKVCIHLVHMGHPVSSMNIYKKFLEPRPSFGLSILKEMLHCNLDIETIISLAKDLVTDGLNPYILEHLTMLALKFKYEEPSWALLSNLKVIRPHYIWPLLVNNGKTNGEHGIFQVLDKAKKLNLHIDYETLEHYVIPYCHLENVELLMVKLQEQGLTLREILSPLLMVLLKNKNTKMASELCSQYNIPISGVGFLGSLAESWALTADSNPVVKLLARYCESNPTTSTDLVGVFLIYAAKRSQKMNTDQKYLKLTKLILGQSLRITLHSANEIKEIYQKFDKQFQKELYNNLHLLVDIALNLTENSSLRHPSDMNLDDLECHLIELQSKNMETRGVLRKLIQMHAKHGNTARVHELRDLFISSGYEESSGIKSAIMHNYVLGGHLQEALKIYNDLKINDSDFSLDSFKMIDLAKLSIENDKFDEGFSILKNEVSKCKIGNTQPIERNCKELLNTCKSVKQVDEVFEFLRKNRLCETTNMMLGPLVKARLKTGDLNAAVEKFVELAEKHKCTPLQFEIFRAILKEQNSILLEKALRATEKVHGVGPAQVGLIAVLAENGQETALRNVISNIKVPIQNLLQNRCKRWVKEGKCEPLKCLAKVCSSLRSKIVNLDFVYKCILELYDVKNDYKGALEFFKEIPEDYITTNLETELHRIQHKSMNIKN
ncbi:hypothetical protein ABEB36_005813 [Hypothenemus hampei]|uniref:Leucine-rich PPR motif-containing protein, mitochondrial n=1 Tax=Hypothenemus hampei TaxID=57062 RepID=A0ABD1EZM3_HYPHA